MKVDYRTVDGDLSTFQKIERRGTAAPWPGVNTDRRRGKRRIGAVDVPAATQ